MNYREKISWIKGTPLGLGIRSVEYVPLHMHENLIEIIFCLKGSITFSFLYEEITLSAGDFLVTEIDAHFIHGETGDNICISFYIDLEFFFKSYPFVSKMIFVCEGTKKSKNTFSEYYLKQMKGILLSILYTLLNRKEHVKDYEDIINKALKQIVDLLLSHFDILYEKHPDLKTKPELLERNRSIIVYLHTHFAEKITLDTIANEFNYAKGYMSEYLKEYMTGFRKDLSYFRANHAEKLLLTTNMNIYDISDECGFSDPKYFNSAFEGWYGCLPKQFRIFSRDKINESSKESELDLDDIRDPLYEMMLNYYTEFFCNIG